MASCWLVLYIHECIDGTGWGFPMDSGWPVLTTHYCIGSNSSSVNWCLNMAYIKQILVSKMLFY